MGGSTAGEGARGGGGCVCVISCIASIVQNPRANPLCVCGGDGGCWGALMEETWVAALQVRGAAWGLVCVCVNTQGTKTSTARRHGGDRLKVNVMDCLCFVGGGEGAESRL